MLTGPPAALEACAPNRSTSTAHEMKRTLDRMRVPLSELYYQYATTHDARNGGPEGQPPGGRADELQRPPRLRLQPVRPASVPADVTAVRPRGSALRRNLPVRLRAPPLGYRACAQARSNTTSP